MSVSISPEQLLDHRDFADRFRGAIRVGFNWERFFAEAWPIEPVILRTRDDLARCCMPWYIGKSGNEVNYDHEEAAPMCMKDVPKALGILNDERQKDIHDYARQFKNTGALVEFSAPTYALPENGHFVLDRNHRLSALTLVNVPYRVTLWNVRGPLEPECLLDLEHWIGKRSPHMKASETAT